MVHEQLLRRGVNDDRVLGAMATVPRERFVPAESAADAYTDQPLPIGYGQTISQPYVVARIAELLQLSGNEQVLDVGAGSGYQAAVLAALVPEGRVFAIERIPELAERARRCLSALHCPVTLLCADGSAGWPEHAPYDAIAVAAAAPTIPKPLCDQLRDGGRLIIPVGAPSDQRLTVVCRRGDHFAVTADVPVRFVPLLGEYGFPVPAGTQK